MKKFTVLIVEDEFYIAEGISSVLQKAGYNTVIALTYQEGLDCIEKGDFDLALLDIKLEEASGDGIDLAAVIKEKLSIPIIFLTAYGADESIKERAINIQPAGFHEKGSFDLVKQLEELLEADTIAYVESRNPIAEQVTGPAKEGIVCINPRIRVMDPADKRNTEVLRRIWITLEDLLYVTSLTGNNQSDIKIITKDKVYFLNISLDSFERQLDECLPDSQKALFVRVHRSFVLNTAKIAAFDKEYVYVHSEEDHYSRGIPIKPLFYQELLNRYPRLRC